MTENFIVGAFFLVWIYVGLKYQADVRERNYERTVANDLRKLNKKSFKKNYKCGGWLRK